MTSRSDCSYPSGMPADGYSRRPWRQLEDFAAESGFLQHRQRPRRWHGALQLHEAWHAAPGPCGPHGQWRVTRARAASHSLPAHGSTAGSHPLGRKGSEIGTTGQTTGNTVLSGTERTCCTAHAIDIGTQRRGVDLALECKHYVPAVPHHWLP